MTESGRHVDRWPTRPGWGTPYRADLPEDAGNPGSLSLADLEREIDEQMNQYPNGSRYADLLLEEYERR